MQNYIEKVNVTNHEKLGRRLFANMDIEAGEIILEERPLLVTPHWDCEQMKCAQCTQDSFVMCKKCQFFPLCMDCTSHDEFECQFFTTPNGSKISKNLLVKNYAIYATLKLLLRMENPKTCADCEGLVDMSVELDEIRETEMWLEHDEQVCRPLLLSGIEKCFKKHKLDTDFLHRLCIMIDDHAFEVTAPNGDSLKGVYVCASQLPHHCVPNTAISFDENYNLIIYAAVTIRPGDVIYNSYTNPLMGTSQRQHQLRMSRRIDCRCTRCLDATEMGTHMSSMKCKQCSGGYAVCQIGASGNWVCNECDAVMEAVQVHRLLAEVGEAMVSANGDLHIYETLLAKFSPNFHQNHFLLIDIKQNIATILRAVSAMNSMNISEKKILERRVQLCEEILPIVRAVIPGVSKLYAISLFEYLMPFLELAELEFKASDISRETYYHKMEMAKKITVDSLELLRFEPINSPEGYLAQRIIIEQKRIEDELNKK